jgi:predicted dehydrogenase
MGPATTRATAAQEGGAKTYGVALLSNAMHLENFARAFAPHPRLRILCVVDEPGQEPYVEGRNRALASRYGVPYAPSLDALDDPAIDVVAVDGQIERRARLAGAAARPGKHLWIDKPPAMSAADLLPVVDAVEGAGVTSMVFCHVAAPWLAALRAALLDGRIGELHALHLDYQFTKGDPQPLDRRLFPAGAGPREVWTMRDTAAGADPTESGHNVIAKRELAEEGWYSLAAAHRLCPRPVTRVYATGGAYFFAAHRDRGVEDFATLSLTLDDGTLVTISTGRTGRRTHAGAGRMGVRAAGSRGSIAVDGGQPATVTFRRTPGPEPSTGTGREGVGIAQLVDHFVACLDGRDHSVLPVATAHGLLRVVDAAYESIATGQPVALAPAPAGAAR